MITAYQVFALPDEWVALRVRHPEGHRGTIIASDSSGFVVRWDDGDTSEYVVPELRPTITLDELKGMNAKLVADIKATKNVERAVPSRFFPTEDEMRLHLGLDDTALQAAMEAAQFCRDPLGRDTPRPADRLPVYLIITALAGAGYRVVREDAPREVHPTPSGDLPRPPLHDKEPT